MALDTSTSALNLRRRYVEGLLFRVVPAVLFAVFLGIAASFGVGLTWHHLVPVLWLLVFIGLVNVPYWYAGKRAGFPLSHFYVHWAIDLVVITAIVYFLGGIDMPLVQFAYLMMIVIAAIFVSHGTAYFLATGAALAYGLLGIAEVAGWLPYRSGIWAHHYGPEIRVFIVLLSAVFFYVFAYLTGTLAALLRRANEELAGTKALVEEQNRLLEQRVKERTQLLEARTHELQERTDELEELLHIVTHDLQNVAVASTETVRKLMDTDGAQLSERGRRYSERLVRDCRLMASMLRDLLEVVTQTQVVQHRELVDVHAVVQEAVARAQTAIDGKGIEITIGDLPPLHADRQKMHHVFDNLVSNACKYVGDKPKPRIEIGGAVRNGAVEYVVRDNGVGIEPNQVGRIFQLYHRAPDQTVAGVVQQGHGIGLAVVKRIVQRFGGRMWVESVPGEGSSFYLSFPREERKEP
jgi:signal transduction histidine kinase